MFSQTVTGIIIKITNFQEADKIVTIFSKELGKTQFIAKGVRKVNSKTSGVVDLFVDGTFEVTAKSQLPTLIQAHLNSWFPYLRTSLGHWQYAERAAKALMRATKEHDAHPELYFLFQNFLEVGKGMPNAQWWWLTFLWQLLFLSGFGIHLANCINCAEVLTNKNVASKSISYEGFRCQECSLKADSNDILIYKVLDNIQENKPIETNEGFSLVQGYLEDAFRYHFL